MNYLRNTQTQQPINNCEGSKWLSRHFWCRGFQCQQRSQFWWFLFFIVLDIPNFKKKVPNQLRSVNQQKLTKIYVHLMTAKLQLCINFNHLEYSYPTLLQNQFLLEIIWLHVMNLVHRATNVSKFICRVLFEQGVHHKEAICFSGQLNSLCELGSRAPPTSCCANLVVPYQVN